LHAGGFWRAAKRWDSVTDEAILNYHLRRPELPEDSGAVFARALGKSFEASFLLRRAFIYFRIAGALIYVAKAKDSGRGGQLFLAGCRR